MKQQHSDGQVVPYPKIRRLIAAEFRSFHHTRRLHGRVGLAGAEAAAQKR